jgi:phosphate-selective porin OprO/OprP
MNVTTGRWMVMLVLAATCAAARNATAAQSSPATADDVDQRLKIVERKLELAEEQAAEKAKSAAGVSAGADGFGLKSADGAFQLRIRGLLQTDGRFFLGDDRRPAADTWVLRRARPIVEGTVWKLVDFRLMPDFGGGTAVIQDAYFDLKLSNALRVRVGKAKVPLGLEALLNDENLPFIERGLPSLLAPVRDVGVQLTGEPWNGRLTYAAGIFNGAPDGATGDVDNGDDKDFAARLFVRPFQRPATEAPAAVGLGLGIAASSGKQSGTPGAPNLPSFRTPGQQTFFSYRGDGTAAGTAIADGDRTRFAPQGWIYSGPLLAFAEWTTSRQEVARGAERAELTNRAWQVVGVWAVTGENVTERGLTPRRPFAAGDAGWGALQISLRYGVLDVDRDAFPRFADPARSPRRATNAGLCLAWLLNRGVRWGIDYERVRFDGGDGAGDREREQVLLTRFQLSF